MSDNVKVDVQQYSAPPIKLENHNKNALRLSATTAALEMIRASCVAKPNNLGDGIDRLGKYVAQIEACLTEEGGQSGSEVKPRSIRV